jgi:hypothetical protein
MTTALMDLIDPARRREALILSSIAERCVSISHRHGRACCGHDDLNNR